MVDLKKYLNFEAVKKPKYKGRVYKRIKTFKDPAAAEVFLEELKKTSYRSKRYPPFIEKTSIGLRMGFVYRICVPE